MWRFFISIHALHEESDEFGFHFDFHPEGISIHALHEESDAAAAGARVETATAISIHALHEESDASVKKGAQNVKFQSTLSMRRATVKEWGL